MIAHVYHQARHQIVPVADIEVEGITEDLIAWARETYPAPGLAWSVCVSSCLPSLTRHYEITSADHLVRLRGWQRAHAERRAMLRREFKLVQP